MDMRGHQLIENEQKKLVCTRCQRAWSSLKHSRRRCPGIPWYVVGMAPSHLYTYTQLKKKGLRPKDRRVAEGCIVTAHADLVYLYSIDQAIARRKETEKQRAARLAAWPRIQEKYKCEHCEKVPQSLSALQHDWYRVGLCTNCQEMLEWQAKQESLHAKLEQDRRDVCAWAYHLLQRTDWALIDTETTSLDGVVCEIGLINPDGSVLFESLVNPECPVSKFARLVHKISDEELAAAPTLPQLWPQLQEALHDRPLLIAYNAAFDRARLTQSARRYQLQELTQEWECAMEAYAAFCGNWSDHHGSYTWVPLQGSHRAIGDALAALACLREMAAAY